MHLQSLLSEKRFQLTPAQGQVMKYIMDNYDDVLFLTASKLGQKAGVSEATVVRLSQTLGFDGYPAMQRRLRENLQDRLSTVTRLKQVVNHTRDGGNILIKIMQEDLQNLSLTVRDIPIETFHQAVAEIETAQRIFVAGFRGAHAPALTLVLYLRLLKQEAHLLVPGYGDVWDVIYGVNCNDLVMGISVPRYTRLTVEIIEYAYKRGARIGVITDSVLSPLARYAHWVLPVHSRLDSFMESLTAAMSLVNALVTAISVQDPEKTLKALNDREALWRAKEIYVSTHGSMPKDTRGGFKGSRKL